MYANGLNGALAAIPPLKGRVRRAILWTNVLKPSENLLPFREEFFKLGMLIFILGIVLMCDAAFCEGAARPQSQNLTVRRTPPHSKFLRVEEWQHTQYIWNFGLISLCDKGVPLNPVKFFEGDAHFIKRAYHNIASGDVVWISCRFIPQFFREVLSEVKHPFVLVIADGDESFPTDCGLSGVEIEEFISNDKIIHIFAQNFDWPGYSDKVSNIPLGLDFHTIGYKSAQGGWGEKGSPLQQEAYLRQLLIQLSPTYMRRKRAFVDFQLSDTMKTGTFKRYLQCGEDRTSIFERLLMTGLIDHAGRMKRSELWKTKGEYAFSISPHGNGLDCHRTWEDLILGCIVIVKASPLDPLYEGLPVVIVNDWSEITEENMEKWLSLYGDAFTNPEYRDKLTNEYWFSKIRTAAAPYRLKR